jgi:hypothetical protein
MHLSYSLVMPIHNQAAILPGILSKLKENTVGDYEIIFILDGCTDTSEAIVRTFSFNCPVTVIVNPSGLFETSCDNQGFKAARGEFIVEIQADMEMTTYGYNKLLCRPLEVFPDLIAVSGRCCHTLRGPESGVGKLGRLVEGQWLKSLAGWMRSIMFSVMTNMICLHVPGRRRSGGRPSSPSSSMRLLRGGPLESNAQLMSKRTSTNAAQRKRMGSSHEPRRFPRRKHVV